MDKCIKSLMTATNREKLPQFKETFDKIMTAKVRGLLKSNLFEAYPGDKDDMRPFDEFAKGDYVVFNWETSDGLTFDDPDDWGFESEEEVDELRDRDGGVAKIDVEATDGYYDITFNDGYELVAVSGAHLTHFEKKNNKLKENYAVETFKKGDRVGFGVADDDPTDFENVGTDDSKWDEIVAHDGQEATIETVGEKGQTYDIVFDDGYKLGSVSVFNLSPIDEDDNPLYDPAMKD